MRRRLLDDRGALAVVVAVLMPMVILLLALVMDVGNWYTHKRQLQNRADAAALAAGVAYAKNWKTCVKASDPSAQAAAGNEIADAARQYAGDPDPGDFTTPPSAEYNTEIADQSKLDVTINSTNYDDNSDYSDGGNPCFKHSGDAISPAGGEWTDVKVKETDLPSFVPGILSMFGVDTALAKNGARARVEIRPVASGTRFLPLAIPITTMSKVQIRYYDGCKGTLLATRDLAPLPSGSQQDFTNLGGGVIWALPDVANPAVGNPDQGFTLAIPSYDPTDCGSSPYRPVKVEVRLASQPQVNLNQTCGVLQGLRYADCFSDVSRIRVWPDGNPATHPLIKNVKLSGGCNTRADAYFSAYDGIGTTPSCGFQAAVDIDFGTRQPPGQTNFKVFVNNTELLPPGGGTPTGTWTTSGNLPASEGPNLVTVKLTWKNGTTNREYSEPAQQVFVGTDDVSGALDLVRTSLSPTNGSPGPALDNVEVGGVSKVVFPSVGIRTALRPGVLTTLRNDKPQGSQLVQCDPSVTNGHDLENFLNGCQPWFGENPLTNGIWWDTSTQQCPSYKSWYKTNAPAPYTNSPTNPWRCVKNAPGRSLGQSGDWLAVGTGNCLALNGGGNQCKTYKTTTSTPKANCGNYDGKPGDSQGWVQKGGDSGDPRVVSVFIVPYQAYKGVTGSGNDSEIPILGFASYYVMNWTGEKAAESDPCPDPDFNGVTVNPPGSGSSIGVFVETVEYSTGPIDPTGFCREGQLLPCRAALVR